jgi:hypothetical protein
MNIILFYYLQFFQFTNYKETFITFVNKDGVKLGITKKNGYYLHT